MVSKEQAWGKKAPRKITSGFKRTNFGRKAKRLDMASREPTLAKKAPRKTRDGFKRTNFGKKGPRDFLAANCGKESAQELTWAKKVPRIKDGFKR